MEIPASLTAQDNPSGALGAGVRLPMPHSTVAVTNLSEMAPLWQALTRADCSPVQQFMWTDVCTATLPLSGEPLIVAVKTGADSGAIVPLVKLRGVLQRLEHLGVKYLHEPADLLHTDLNALKALAVALAKLRLPLSFDRLPADSHALPALRRAFGGRGLIVERPSKPYPRIKLSEDWRQPESQLNSGRRSDLRRALRHAEKIGPIQYDILAPTPEDLPPLLAEALDVEQANWKGREGSAVAQDEVRGNFYRQYAAAASQAGTLRLCFLRVNGQAIAMQYAVECGGSFWLLKIGYREEFARCSPGLLLIAETIRYAVSKGLLSYEFLGTAESWTRVWTKDESESVSLTYYPFGARGVAALAIDGARSIRNRLARRQREAK